MATAVQLFGTGKFFSVTGAGSPGDPYVPQLSSGMPVTAVPFPGTGGYFGVASGSGTPDDPFVLAVNATVALPIDLPAVDPVFQVDAGGNLYANSINVNGYYSLGSAAIFPSGISISQYGQISSGSQTPCSFASVDAINTSSIADSGAQAAIIALCAALGIPTY